MVDAANRWLDAVTDRPFFAWVHLYDAHAPYEAPPAYAARFRGSPYDAAIAYVDECIGRLVAELEKTGRLDRTIVSVVADHGESLGDHGEREHGVFLYDATLHVPWILRLPGKAHAGTVVATQVRAIDVSPTIEQLAGVPVAEGIDGESVVPAIEGREPRDPPPSYAETFYPRLHFGLSDLRSVRVGDWKYIDAPHPELYELSRDRHETENRAGTRGQLVAGLAAEAQRIESTFGRPSLAEPRQPDAETLARLKSLGYVGVVAPASAGRGGDPKDAIKDLERLGDGLERAHDMIAKKRPDLAIDGLKPLLKTNERSYELHLTLGDAYYGARQFREAIDEYAAAGMLNPTAAAPALAAARAYLELRDMAHASEQVAEAERLEPGSGEARLTRGMIAEMAGRGAEALRDYEAALEANPSDMSARARVAGMALLMRDLDLARRQFTTLVGLGYRPSRMHFGLGQVAQARGDARQAAIEYREALRLEPGFAPAKAALQQVTSR